MGSKKTRHEENILQWLGDPEKDWLTREQLALRVCRYKNPQTIYGLFSPAELDKLEKEAFELRNQRTAGRRAMVYDAMYKSAIGGDVQAMKAYLDRTEGPVVKKIEASGPNGGPIEMTDTVKAAKLAAILEAARVRMEKNKTE